MSVKSGGESVDRDHDNGDSETTSNVGSNESGSRPTGTSSSATSRCRPEGYQIRLSDSLNRPDIDFIPLVDAEVMPLQEGAFEPVRHDFLVYPQGARADRLPGRRGVQAGRAGF